MRDLHDIFTIAQEDAPPPRHSVDDIVAAGRRRRGRVVAQRIGGVAVVAAAVATAGLLVAVNLAVPGSPSAQPARQPVVAPSPTVPAASPPFTFTFTGFEAGGYRVLAPDEVTLAYQGAAVVRDVRDAKGKVTTQYAGTLTVYQPRMFSPARFRGGTVVTVQGREAFHSTVQQPSLDGWNTQASGTVTVVPDPRNGGALAWQYAPESWAVLQDATAADQTSFALADQLAVAERFAPSATSPSPARVPYRVGHLPQGFVLQAVSGQSMTAQHRGMVSFVYSQPRTTAGPLAARRDPARDTTVPSVVISVLWRDTPPKDAVKRTSRCNAGQHWCATNLPGGQFWFAVEDPSKTLSDQELLKVADSLVFASLKDETTWYAVR
ncbi:MAG: hypothetical protein HOV79_31530 [Hamadaea sp.]|nr:hypothetical protein [Hamadaea sp.]